MATRTRTQRRPRPGFHARSACPYTTEFSDSIRGEIADHWSSPVGRYLCGEHYTVVSQRFTGAASSAAGTCPECGEDMAACLCGASLPDDF